MKVSQLTPSTQAAGSGVTPPGAVPAHVTGDVAVGLRVAEVGLAARAPGSGAKNINVARMRTRRLLNEVSTRFLRDLGVLAGMPRREV